LKAVGFSSAQTALIMERGRNAKLHHDVKSDTRLVMLPYNVVGSYWILVVRPPALHAATTTVRRCKGCTWSCTAPRSLASLAGMTSADNVNLNYEPSPRTLLLHALASHEAIEIFLRNRH